MHYTFVYSRFVKILSVLGLLGLAFLVWSLVTVEEKSLLFLLLGWGGVVALLYPIVSMPISLSDDGECLVLRRLFWTRRYHRSEYVIQEATGVDVGGSVRVFASGGYFGFTGLFWSSKQGLFRLLQTETATNTYLQVTKKKGGRSLYVAYSSPAG